VYNYSVELYPSSMCFAIQTTTSQNFVVLPSSGDLWEERTYSVGPHDLSPDHDINPHQDGIY
jgi:hypothetical protein